MVGLWYVTLAKKKPWSGDRTREDALMVGMGSIVACKNAQHSAQYSVGRYSWFLLLFRL